MKKWNRREVIAAGAALGIIPGIGVGDDAMMLAKAIPASGETLPVIGLGTYSVFDVESTPDEIALRSGIVDKLIDAGGSLLDTSPMYKRSEKVIGDVIKAGANRDDLFLATKVWTDGKEAGARQMQRSADLMNTDVIDLMQVHNLRGTDEQLPVMFDWKEQGRLGHVGITTHRVSQHADIEKFMNKYPLDFIQVNYSMADRAAAERLLPLAIDRGVAVLVNRPFGNGKLFGAVKGVELPSWAGDIDAESWGQVFLKYIIAHPAQTIPIPGTSKPHHAEDNIGAMYGPLPDAALRREMEEMIDGLI